MRSISSLIPSGPSCPKSADPLKRIGRSQRFGGANIGNSFGFSNTNNTGGTSGAGELGGILNRTPATASAYIADATLGGTLSRLDTLEFSGEIYLANSNFDGSLTIGFFNTATGMNASAFFGFDIEEAGGAPPIRSASAPISTAPNSATTDRGGSPMGPS